MNGQMSLNLFHSGLPRDDKYRQWTKELVRERVVNDLDLQDYIVEDSSYGFNRNLVALYDFSDAPILDKFKTVIFDAKQGIVLTKRCSRQMLNEFFKGEIFLNVAFQRQISHVLGHKYLHAISAWQYAYFALHGYSRKNSDWLSFHQMTNYECQNKQVTFTTKKIAELEYQFTFDNCCRHLAKRISEALHHNQFVTKLIHAYFVEKDWHLNLCKRLHHDGSLLTDEDFNVHHKLAWYSQFHLNRMMMALHNHSHLTYGQVYAESFALPFSLADHQYFYQKTHRRKSIY